MAKLDQWQSAKSLVLLAEKHKKTQNPDKLFPADLIVSTSFGIACSHCSGFSGKCD